MKEVKIDSLFSFIISLYNKKAIMIEINGKYTNAKIMIDDVEETALNQVYNIDYSKK